MKQQYVKLRVDEVARERGLNLSRLQIKAGLTMGVTRRYWYNDTRTVSLDYLGALSIALDVHPRELLSVEYLDVAPRTGEVQADESGADG